MKCSGKRSRSLPTELLNNDARSDAANLLLETIDQYNQSSQPSAPLFVSGSDCSDRSDGSDRYAMWLQSLGFQEGFVGNVWGFKYPSEHVCRLLPRI